MYVSLTTFDTVVKKIGKLFLLNGTKQKNRNPDMI